MYVQVRKGQRHREKRVRGTSFGCPPELPGRGYDREPFSGGILCHISGRQSCCLTT